MVTLPSSSTISICMGGAMPVAYRTSCEVYVCATRRSKTVWFIRFCNGIIGSTTPIVRPSRSTCAAKRVTGHSVAPCSLPFETRTDSRSPSDLNVTAYSYR